MISALNGLTVGDEQNKMSEDPFAALLYGSDGYIGRMMRYRRPGAPTPFSAELPYAPLRFRYDHRAARHDPVILSLVARLQNTRVNRLASLRRVRTQLRALDMLLRPRE